MPDAPAEQASRRPRRTPHTLNLEGQIASLEQRLAEAETALGELRRRHDDDVATNLRAVARAEHAERLLARAVAALAQWRDEVGGLNPHAADVLVETVADVLGIDPDHRPPRARRVSLDAAAWLVGDLPDPDDDEP